MNKIYPLFHLNGFIYVLDKEGTFQIGDTAYSIDIEFYKVTMADIPHANKNHWKLIASNDKSLGLLLLSDIEENESTIIEAAKNNGMYGGYAMKDYHPFKAGYKANKGKYTEEDIRKTFQAAREFNSIDGVVDIDVVITYKGADNSDLSPVFATPDDYLKSLNPLPIAVEVEMEEENDFTNQGFKGIKMPFHPKVINNIIQVIKWIYE